jgi:predicted transcriptional regulator of viral defense system
MRKQLAQVLLEAMAKEHRRVLSDWRAMLVIRRATRELPEDQRRWTSMPENRFAARRQLWLLCQRGYFEPLKTFSYLYVQSQEIPQDAPNTYEILMEANPSSALAYINAMHFHGLTNDLPKVIHLAVPIQRHPGELPLSTTEEDWEGLHSAQITYHFPKIVLGTKVLWHKLRTNRVIGIRTYSQNGPPIRATSPERTLLDGLLDPDWCGGFGNVLQAWEMAADSLDLDHLIECVELLQILVLRQRVGFLLEHFNRAHPILDLWASNAKQGGSNKLDPSAPFSPFKAYSERWKLPINTLSNLV